MTDRVAANSLSELDAIAHQCGYLNAALCDAKKVRDGMVLDLLAQGFSEREVAQAARLTGPRIHQIKEAAACTTPST